MNPFSGRMQAAILRIVRTSTRGWKRIISRGEMPKCAREPAWLGATADPVAEDVPRERGDDEDQAGLPERHADRAVADEQADHEEQRVAREEESEQEAALREDDQRREARQPVGRRGGGERHFRIEPEPVLQGGPLDQALVDPAIAPGGQRRLDAGGGMEPFTLKPDAFAALIRRDTERYAKLVAEVGAKIE